MGCNICLVKSQMIDSTEDTGLEQVASWMAWVNQSNIDIEKAELVLDFKPFVCLNLCCSFI